jgi:hypothetical protein
VVDDEGSGSTSRVSVPRISESTSTTTQTASFDVPPFRLELSAAPGAARLVVVHGDDRDAYAVDPTALSAWASAFTRLMSLESWEKPRGHVEFRAPFLIDREGRASVAFHGIVDAHAVSYRLLVCGAASRVVGVPTTAGVVRDVAAAVAGAVAIATGPLGPSGQVQAS